MFCVMLTLTRAAPLNLLSVAAYSLSLRVMAEVA
jgi:hypothetical protein